MKKGSQHTWEFTKYFRTNAYGWKGTALASKRIKAAIKEINAVAKKEPTIAAEGAVIFIEKCWRAIEHIDSSSGAIGTAVGNAVIEIVQVIHDAPLAIEERQKLIERIWDSWEEEGYGYYDELSEKWTELCAEPEIMTYWADSFLPIVKQIFSTDTPRSCFKGSEPCLSCLFETGRYDEIIEIVKSKSNPIFHYQKYVIKVVAATGEVDKALSMIDECLGDSYSTYQAAHLGEEILLKAGRVEEAYKRYGLMMPFQTTGLATLSAIRKKYPKISPQRILSDLLDADSGNERRYFAAARQIGMIELAIEIAEKYDVEPKTLTTACKDYLKKDSNLSLKFGLLALQKYADGYGYEPEYTDVHKCYDLVLKSADNAGKTDEVNEKVQALVERDRSIRKLVSSVVNYRQVTVKMMKEQKN
ncbi:MAG: hypothetical protein JW915_11175 [Chitinispirillaceae bacterium]|nr:hypothetical protein [Chitinispirillaceae bacterium]